MKILMISNTFPYPPNRGGTQVRTFNLLKYLGQQHHLTLLTQRTPEVTDLDIAKLRQYLSELVVFSPPPTASQGIGNKIQRLGQFLLSGVPPNVGHLYSEEMQQWVDKGLEAGKFEAIACEHSVNEIYIRPQWSRQLKTVVNVHSSVYRTCSQQLATKTTAKPWRDRLYLPLLRRYERSYLQKFSAIAVTTDEDLQHLQALVPEKKITLVPNGVDLEVFPYRSADPGGRQLIFFGGLDYFANIDAACFFAREIFPLVRANYPHASLTLVGSKPAPEVQALAQRGGITVTGRVPSIAEYLHRAAVCVIPMRVGLGMKNKTLEAMAAGTPVIGSDRAFEGLNVDGDGVPLRALRAGKVEEYVGAIGRLFEDQQLRQELSRNARVFIEEQYTWERAAILYEQIFNCS